ncbi:MAG: hypothetical protein KC457_14800 [Myxococcales bacterium]|nr:hypothetical protein [Myxococcales bacterium]
MSSENPRRPPHQSRRPARLHEIEFFPFPEDRATSREAAAALFADLAFAARLDMVIDNARGWFIEHKPDFVNSDEGSRAS